MRVDLREFLLVKGNRLASLVENQEARAGGALVNATNEDSVEAIAVDVSSPESLFVIWLTVAERGIEEVTWFVPLSAALAAARRGALRKRVAVEKR